MFTITLTLRHGQSHPWRAGHSLQFSPEAQKILALDQHINSANLVTLVTTHGHKSRTTISATTASRDLKECPYRILVLVLYHLVSFPSLKEAPFHLAMLGHQCRRTMTAQGHQFMQRRSIVLSGDMTPMP
ncbi:hypothetical protein KJ359_004564 [Pestalotiopsis sp. 9143b]|nr:hypothetical protein KJ359_004564 [Pestalotiopsis sp. 9143b]